MDPISGIDENGDGTEGGITDQFSLDTLLPGSSFAELSKKSIELINKNIKLTKYQKQLYGKKFYWETEYFKQKNTIEVTAIKENNTKNKTEKLTKDQLNIIIEDKIDINIRQQLKEIENQIDICELISKNHHVVSEQIKNYNSLQNTYNKYIKSEAL